AEHPNLRVMNGPDSKGLAGRPGERLSFEDERITIAIGPAYRCALCLGGKTRTNTTNHRCASGKPNAFVDKLSAVHLCSPLFCLCVKDADFITRELSSNQLLGRQRDPRTLRARLMTYARILVTGH